MSTIRRIDSRIDQAPLFDLAAARRIEDAAVRSAGPFTLMQRAGDAVHRLALALAPHAHRILVFAGPGNNGGDGFVAATRLHANGVPVEVILVGDPARLPPDAARAHAEAVQAAVPVRVVPDFDAQAAATSLATRTSPPADLVIDALLGIGASRAPSPAIGAAIRCIADHAARGARVLAVDSPSGLDAFRGQPFGDDCVDATDTLSLLTLKAGLFTAKGRDHAGRVWFDDLGVALEEDAATARLVGCAEAADDVGRRLPSTHKGSFGDVAVVGGAHGMAGAALLAATAAHAAGAGRVFVDLLDDSLAALDPLRPELMFRAGWWKGSLDALRESVVVCGCGGGDAVREALPRLLSAASRLVVDADALNAISADASLQTLLAARAGRGQQTILTPHPLEAARLLGTSADVVQADRLAAASALVERYRCTAVVKGSGSIIAAPGARPQINVTGNAALATAGTGDVLAGWIGGRWRKAMAAFDVATRAVIEHGAAAEPERTGSLRAADLVEALHRRSRRPITDA